MRYLFIANRLPYTLTYQRGYFQFVQSAGGLSTALRSYAESSPDHSLVWIGWPGLEVKPKDQSDVTKRSINQFSSLPVFLSQKEIDDYYNGFSNQTLWPLFHYFTSYVAMQERYWNAYQNVNKIFASTITSFIQPDDVIVVHDYQLMLVPHLLREKGVRHKIGFFLHTPFPSYEIFRILPIPWQQKLIEGLLGADLVGFHTGTYQKNFLETATATLGAISSLGTLNHNNHTSHTGVFPIGIDYPYFHEASKGKEVQTRKRSLKERFRNQRIIVSVDRLDYSKELVNRLKGYQIFLKHHPEYLKKIVFLLTLIPSRTDVAQYQQTKKTVSSLIRQINIKFGTSTWKPVHVQHKSLSHQELLAHYTGADIALVTPARDGMNLVAKEFVATRNDRDGVLVLSKFAGSAHGLTGAILVNPYKPQTIAKGIYHALGQSLKEQATRITMMQENIKTHDINQWVQSFLKKLKATPESLPHPPLHTTHPRKFFREYENAQKRLLLFDYDGTLVPLASTPEQAKPTSTVLTLLYALSQDSKNRVAVISGRDRETLDSWIGWLPILCSAEHGAWIKDHPYSEWRNILPLSSQWKKDVLSLLTYYKAGIPNSFIEEKEYSLAFHYRLSPQKLADIRIHEMLYTLQTLLANSPLHSMKGNKVIEIKNTSINKGIATFHYLSQEKPDFILTAGDDTTDEDMFSVLPDSAYTIKIGDSKSQAQFHMKHPSSLLKLLEILVLKSEYLQKEQKENISIKHHTTR